MEHKPAGTIVGAKRLLRAEAKFGWGFKMKAAARRIKRVSHGCLAALLLCGIAVSFDGMSPVAAHPETQAHVQPARFVAQPRLENAMQAEVRGAVASFVRGISQGDVQTVWDFASEEEQAAFGTEEAAFVAFYEAYPAFAHAKEITFVGYSIEGDTPFVEISVRDRMGQRWQAELGLWLDDAGDWKIISCAIDLANDRMA